MVVEILTRAWYIGTFDFTNAVLITETPVMPPERPLVCFYYCFSYITTPTPHSPMLLLSLLRVCCFEPGHKKYSADSPASVSGGSIRREGGVHLVYNCYFVIL